MTNLSLVLLISIFAISCASRIETVTKKMNDHKGVAYIKSDSLEVGKKLQLMDINCDEVYVMSDVMTNCPLKKYGEVKITRIINDHYVEFQTESGSSFEVGTIIKDSH